MCLFDEADVIYQVDDGSVSSVFKFMIWAKGDAVVLAAIARDILKIKVSGWLLILLLGLR